MKTTTKKTETKTAKTETKKPNPITQNAETRKTNLSAAEAIGSALSGADKLHAVAVKLEDKATSAALRFLLDSYRHKNRKGMNEKALKAAGLSADDASRLMLSASTLYKAAVTAADTQRKEDAAKRANNNLFTEWKFFLSLLAGETVKAAASDREELVEAVKREQTEGETYKPTLNAEGEVIATLETGVKHTTAASFGVFIKKAQRLAVERIMGFDGIASVNTSKTITAANAAKKEETVTGVSIEKLAAEKDDKAEQPAA